MTDILLIAVLVALMGCILMAWTLYFQADRLSRVLTVQLNGIAESYRIGFEALVLDIDRLKDRVAELELRE